MDKNEIPLGDLTDMLLSNLGLGIAVMDREGRILYWNREMSRHSGLLGEQVRSRFFWEVYPEFLGLARVPPSMPPELSDMLRAFESGIGTGSLERGLAETPIDGKISLVSRRLKAVWLKGETFLIALSGDDARTGDPREARDGIDRAMTLMLDDGMATFWEYENEGSLIKANAAWARRFSVEECGRGRYSLLSYFERIHPEDLGAVQRAVDAFVADPSADYDIEYRLRESGGAYVWIYDRTLSQERDSVGQLTRCIGRSVDVSRRKELEYSVNEKTLLLRQVLDQSPQCMFVRDSGGRFVLVNRAMADFYGKAPEDLIGAALLDVHPDGEEAKRQLADDLHVVRTGESLLLPETVLTGPDGRKRIMELFLVPFVVPGLPSGSILGFGIDITDMKRAQSALFDEKERLSVTLRSLGEGVIATDTSGKIVLMNPMAQSITGWDEREALGLEIGIVFKVRYGQDSHPFADPVGEILSERRIVSGSADTFLEKRSGELREITERGAPIINEEGDVAGAVLIFLDVTERRAMEREIEKIQKVEALGLLAGGIAHDFNNILMAVLGNISLAKLGMEESDENWGLLTESERAILQAKRLTSQLSVMAKGGAEPVKETLSIETLAREACAINLRGSKVDFEIDIQESLPEVEADPAQMNQVMQNLIINAREAMPMGGRVRVAARSVEIDRSGSLPLGPGPYVRFDVIDSGMGIPPEIAQRIFDPYYTTKSRGSGLGLTVSFSLVKRHGGCITVKSRPGEGTTFSVYLPAKARPDG